MSGHGLAIYYKWSKNDCDCKPFEHCIGYEDLLSISEEIQNKIKLLLKVLVYLKCFKKIVLRIVIKCLSKCIPLIFDNFFNFNIYYF